MLRFLPLAISSLATLVAIAPPSRAAYPLFPNQPGVDVFFPGLESFGRPRTQQYAPIRPIPIINHPPGQSQTYIIVPVPYPPRPVIYPPLYYPYYPYPCYPFRCQ
ncbi:hypothetical protein RHK62_08810 [Thermosynechococcus sp. HY213]|uniref:hypothetical protein n=1 Tax=Thermosynechococcus sp. HY213 TaxID=3074104 RepID=UPI0028552FFB|nr:hypothetical protein [Thermosynechococcus sp. HY213]MDR7922283.1 hypothetical protein [Thermosynechococcus sp. HY213]